MTQQPFPNTFANFSAGNNPVATIDQNFAVCVRGPTPTVIGTVPYWDTTAGTSLNAGIVTNPAVGFITALIGIDSSNRLPAVNGSLLTNLTQPALRSYLAGMGLSNDGVTPNSVLDIAAGFCTDSTGAVGITLGAFTKSTGGAWVSGTGNNGMGNGLTIANSTWYHVIAIVNGGNADIYFDTSASAANKPVGTTAFRRIGSFKTDGSAHIIAFVQYGDFFEWLVPVQDITATNPGTSAVTATLASSPLGVTVRAWFNGYLNNVTTSNAVVYFSDLATTDGAAASGGPRQSLVGQTAGASSMATGDFYIQTNTSAQIRYRLSGSGAADVVNINTKGWIDRRGQDS